MGSIIMKFLPYLIPYGIIIILIGVVWVQRLIIKSLKRKKTEMIVKDLKKQKEIKKEIREKSIKYEEQIINAKDKTDSHIIINRMADDIVHYFDKIDSN